MTRRLRCFACLVLVGLGSWSAPARSEGYPDRPITFVVPFPAGGGSDLMARQLGSRLQTILGQPIVIQNKPGAGGNIGAGLVAHAKPDGYTLMLTAAPFAIASSMYKDLSFDPVHDFTPIAQIATVPLLIVTRPDSSIRTVADLVAQAKKPGSHLTFASFGNGSPPHLVGESINMLAHVRLEHVPYKGTSTALPDLLGGRIDVAILDAVSMTPFVKSGQVRAIAITGPKRAPALPDVPTLVESGVPFKTVGWHGMFGPAKMPVAVVAQLGIAIDRVLADPTMKAFIVENGSIPIDPPLTQAQWAAQFQDDVHVWGHVAAASGAKVE